MEPLDCMRNVLRAAGQYHNNTSRLPYLLHQLEALQTVTSRSVIIRQVASTADQLELAECLTFLVSHIQEDEETPELAGRVIKILLNFSYDDSIRKMLHEMFNLCPSLVGQVELHQGFPEDQILIDTLQLLQRLTYGQRISYDQSYVSDLLKLLINNILSKTETVLSPSLGTLANLCRNNVLVQSAIRNMPQFRKLQKTLCSFFEHKNQVLVVFSLSIFSSLSLHDSMGQQVFFESNNVEQTLQTIFSIIKNCFHGPAWKYAADLLSDLLRHSQMQKCIEKYRYLSRCLNDVLSLLATNSSDSIAEVFQLLLSICAVPSIRQTINHRLFNPLTQNGMTRQVIAEVLNKPLTPDIEPLLCCIHWSSHESNCNNNLSLLALEFLSDSIQDCLCDTESSYHVDVITPTLIALFDKTRQNVLSQGQAPEKGFGLSTQKIIKLVKLLAVMCSNPGCKKTIGELVSVDMLSSVIEAHLPLSYLTFAKAVSDYVVDKNQRDTSTECVLILLDFALRMRKSVQGLGDYIHLVLQNPRLMDFQALGLTSTNQDLVAISLRLLTFALGVEESHPDLDLCGAIASLNKARVHQDQSKRPEEDYPIQDNLRKRPGCALENKENKMRPMLSSTLDSNSKELYSSGDSLDSRLLKDEISLQKLIEKMETSIEGKKDLKTAEVIDVFEHRIKAQQIKEEHLNDLLEAKSLALTQADRVIAQLRSRQVTHSAEMKKLQNLLKESYKRNEQVVTQMNDMRMSSEKSQSQFDNLLEEKSEKIETLTKENAEIIDKCSELEDKIVGCKQEIKSISSMKDDLQQAHEKLNEQYKLSCSQSKQLDEERKSLSKHLKEKDASLLRMTTTLESLQAKHNTSEKERTELEKEKEEMETYVEELRTKLNESEKECKQLQQTVKMLDQVNQEQITKLNEKSKKVSELEAELEKHSQIVSFIHTLNLKTDGSKK